MNTLTTIHGPQVEAPSLQSLTQLEEAIARQLQHTGNDNVAELEWVAEKYEGRNGAPSVRFTDIQALAGELRAVLSAERPLTVSQQLALAHAKLFLA